MYNKLVITSSHTLPLCNIRIQSGPFTATILVLKLVDTRAEAGRPVSSKGLEASTSLACVVLPTLRSNRNSQVNTNFSFLSN
jgi:hypothetical protein